MIGAWGTREERPTQRVIERLVEDLRESPVTLPDGENVRLTFSGGACRWKPGDGIRGLLSRADEALYFAKAEGGNTIVHLDEHGSPQAYHPGVRGDGPPGVPRASETNRDRNDRV